MFIKLLRKNHQAILFTLAIHISLLFILSIQTFTLPETKQDIKPIKSFLYTPPKPIEINAPENKTTAIEVTKQEVLKKPPQIKEQIQIQPEEKTKPTIDVTPQENTKNNEQDNSIRYQNPKPINAIRSQLLNLKDTIKAQSTTQEFQNFQRYRQGDMMSGKHIPVPHSNVPLTPEQKRERATSRLGSFDIIKGEDGGCTLIEDLSYLGLDHKPISGFNCGETKFDKNFRQHMEKTLQKLGKGKK